jgi:glyoxylate/hydroxypyruvate reductase
VTSRHLVGIGIDSPEKRRRWVDALTPRLEDCRVVDADQVDRTEVEILVVGNPPGTDLNGFSGLAFIQSTWAGVDALVEGAPPVPIARLVAPALAELMSEFVAAAVLMAHRGLLEYRRRQARGEWAPLPVIPARRRRVGVLGFGELGAPAARRLAVEGFDVLAWARTPRSDEVPVVAGEDGWHRLLERSEILVNLLPLNAATHGILDEAAFDLLGPGATLVNAARGGHVVEEDLLAALDDGRLSDAVLDVFATEPLPVSHPFWSHPRVTVLPHVAAPSDPDDLVTEVATNLRRFLAGETPLYLVER